MKIKDQVYVGMLPNIEINPYHAALKQSIHINLH